MSRQSVAETPAALLASDVRAAVDALACLDVEVGDAERIDQLAALERLQAACVAAQAHVMVAFAESQVHEQAAAGVPARQRGRGVADQIGLACKISPQAASARLGRARALVVEMPCTLRALASGDVSERVAESAVRHTSHLQPAQRRAVDALVAPRLPDMSAREADAAVRRLAYEQDPEAMVERVARAEHDRAVWSRPAPDCMGVLSAALPAAQCVAAYSALDAQARAVRAAGDERSLAQLRADLLVERLTGQDSAADVSVEISLVMSADSLLHDGDEAAHVDGYGPLPAALGRRLAAGGSRSEVARSRAWVRRLFTDPIDGTTVAVDARRREFDGPVRRLLDARDRVCRTPFCDSPIRHRDHVVPYAAGGSTALDNGQGVCERFNYVKEMPGWRTTVVHPGHAVPTAAG
ncbi:HNH endonuclease [Luteipulveratus halotolerans]|uniref:HNH endonuclease n=1 Tax=Luteipulveratus halotolerans TaxID=1631356 RepID=UPI000681762F|nr:HNH endonuclease signature motif containing protein [Luteipulveratus halotolerans]